MMRASESGTMETVREEENVGEYQKKQFKIWIEWPDYSLKL